VAERSVKSLHRTGRVSREKARAVARILRGELESGRIRRLSGKKITRKTTASGRGAIAFHVVEPAAGSTRPGHSRSVRKAARKATR